ncbi:MAG: hypothetical protein QNL12_03675 [Acidimicrobiia bacterium]|nr:hypothetical protein [Acidimicrobiia bacterium]MDX2466389.1 hypothetical protein [Acidimicrobiia bacterium]
MSRRDDAFEVLRAHNPVDDSTLPPGDSPKARSLLAEITATPRPMPRERSRPPMSRRRLIIVVAVMALALIAATWLILRPVTDPISVGCYQAPSLDSNVVAIPSGGALDTNLCVPVWEDGTLSNPEVTPGGDLPPLIGCVNKNGGFAVFPSEDPDLCGRLGLAEPDPQSIPAGDSVRGFSDDLITYFADRDCISVADAERDITQMLVDRDLISWQVQSSPPSPDRPCASFGLDADTETVQLIPIPRP